MCAVTADLTQQAFASGLEVQPSCERLQAGLTEAGQALDGRHLVAALAAAHAAHAPCAEAAMHRGLGLALASSHAAAAPGQQRLASASGRIYQLSVELRLLKARPQSSRPDLAITLQGIVLNRRRRRIRLV